MVVTVQLFFKVNEYWSEQYAYVRMTYVCTIEYTFNIFYPSYFWPLPQSSELEIFIYEKYKFDMVCWEWVPVDELQEIALNLMSVRKCELGKCKSCI